MMNRRKSNPVILVADDDATIRANLAMLLRSESYEVIEAVDGVQAAEALQDRTVSLALLDLNMPGRNGIEVLRGHADRVDEVPVIVITAYGGSSAAIEAMKLGAYDYITKPFDLDEVLFTVRRALTQQVLVAQVQSLSQSVPGLDPALMDEELIGRSPGMLKVFKMIGLVSATREPVLITGESGTGKELVAGAIHRSSNRSDKPFIKINSAALSPTLLESEMFGHEKGAFTGALLNRIGRFEQADGGTLFLDEIGDMDVELQAKLLRVLQCGQFERVGGSTTIQTDVRIISATNRDLPSRIVDGTFREDLLYRLNVVTIELPPLRERREDIPLIAEHIIRRLARKYDWPQLTLSPDAAERLSTMFWPGNVRELQNVLSRAAVLSRGKMIQVTDLQGHTSPGVEPAGAASGGSLLLKEILAETERRVISQALQQEGWNRTRAAEVLGISRRQLFEKIQQYGLKEG